MVPLPGIVLLLALLGLTTAQRVVRVRQGLLRGKTMAATREHVPFLAFLGVPYAAPPTGPLRFKAPMPAQPWEGVRDATELGAKCPQVHNVTSSVGDEDCLYLNVYTPEGSAALPLPVMVWIHGGGFTLGSGSYSVYGVGHFILQSVIVVTFNYRLGALGYLSLLHPEIPGNAGSKDQVMALKWVQQNIAQFGGDPDSVTIFGESAGAASVHSHLLTPMSKGLFARAISQSGTSLCRWATSSGPREKGLRLAAMVNCSHADITRVARCLRTVPARAIVEASNMVTTIQDLMKMNFIPFALVVDGSVKGVQPFLPASPSQLLRTGQFHKVPYIAGVNSEEALFLFCVTTMSIQALAVYKGVIQSIRPDIDLQSFGVDEISAELNNSFLNFTALKTGESNMIHAISDYFFTSPTVKTLTLQAEKTSEPQFLYNFDFDGRLNYVKEHLIAPLRNMSGVPHADDIFYMFHTVLKDETTLSVNSSEMTTLYRMVRMWTNFAKTRNPTPSPDALLNVTWRRFLPSDELYLHIGHSLSLARNLKRGRLDRVVPPPPPPPPGAEREPESAGLAAVLLAVAGSLLAALLMKSLWRMRHGLRSSFGKFYRISPHKP